MSSSSMPSGFTGCQQGGDRNGGAGTLVLNGGFKAAVSVQEVPVRQRPRWSQDSTLRIAAARSGDHPVIQQLLLAVFHGPSSNEFQSTLDDPFFEPGDWLLLKQEEQILSNVRVARREMHFGSLLLPVARIHHLATWPEYRGQGYAGALMTAAERQCVETGAAIGLLKTDIPEFFHRAGWVECGRHCLSQASARDVLSHFEVQKNSSGTAGEPTDWNHRCTEPSTNDSTDFPILSFPFRRRPLNIRLWRHVEQAALMRLYEQNSDATYGSIRRTEDYWRWLISRRGYDRIYVAIDGPDKLELHEATSPIVGYAVVKDERIVEINGDPNCPQAMPQLLTRACADSIERDSHIVQLHAPPNAELHRWMEAAGGTRHRNEQHVDKVFMVKIFNLEEFLLRLRRLFHVRAKAADLSRPCELGLLLGSNKYRLIVTRRGVRLERRKLGRSYISGDATTWQQLLLGHYGFVEAMCQGRMKASTRIAAKLASALFPTLPLWHPPLDELPGGA